MPPSASLFADDVRQVVPQAYSTVKSGVE